MDGEWYQVFYVALGFNTMKLDKKLRGKKRGKVGLLFDNLRATCKEVVKGIFLRR